MPSYKQKLKRLEDKVKKMQDLILTPEQISSLIGLLEERDLEIAEFEKQQERVSAQLSALLTVTRTLCETTGCSTPPDNSLLEKDVVTVHESVYEHLSQVHAAIANAHTSGKSVIDALLQAKRRPNKLRKNPPESMTPRSRSQSRARGISRPTTPGTESVPAVPFNLQTRFRGRGTSRSESERD